MNRLSMQEVQHLLVTEPSWLLSRAGSVWATRDGDPNDYVLGVGDRLALARGDRVAVGAFDAGQPALWDRQPMHAPRRYRLARDAAAFGLGAAARTLRAAAGGLAALARSAAAMACRAQGSIRCGDSIASAGTVQ